MATTRKTRGEYAGSAARREQILNSALDVFASSGFHKGAISEVATRAGISQAGLLHHFPNKAALLEGVLVWRDDIDRKAVDTDFSDQLDRFRAVIKLVKRNQKRPGLVKLYATLQAEATSADHPAHDYFLRRTQWVVSQLTDALTDGIKQGIVKPDVDPPSAARAAVALMDGLQVQWLLDRKSVDMAEDVRRYIQSLLTVEL